MKPALWEKCIDCKVNCCKNKTISYTLFLTKEETIKFPELNRCQPCKYPAANGLCEIHEQRPTDCRLFPFEIVKEMGKFFWAYWNTDCPMTNGGGTEAELEACLVDIEAKIIPTFKEYLEAYSQFRQDEFIKNFGQYIILREINL